MLNDTQIGIHAEQKGSLLFFARFFLAGLVVMLGNGVIKVAFSALANINTIGFNGYTQEVNALGMVLESTPLNTLCPHAPK